MNFRQKVLLAIYLPVTAVILVMDKLMPVADIVILIKYGAIITLFIHAASVEKSTVEQKKIFIAFCFLAIGDFFLVFFDVLNFEAFQPAPFGGVAFFCAYLCLVSTYHKSRKIDRKEWLVAIPIASVLLMVILFLRPYISGLMFVGILVFGSCLCFMTWSGVCTVFRKYYTNRVSMLIALSACLMLICDFGVGITHFYPGTSSNFYPWVTTITWAAYIPAWTLLNLVISEKNLRIDPENCISKQ